MIRARTFPNFDLTRATVLAGLIALGFWATAHPVGAAPLTVDEVLATAAPGPAAPLELVPMMIDLQKDGKVFVESSLGHFEGVWSVAGTTLCLYFDGGPKVGITCGTIDSVEETQSAPWGKTSDLPSDKEILFD